LSIKTLLEEIVASGNGEGRHATARAPTMQLNASDVDAQRSRRPERDRSEAVQEYPESSSVFSSHGSSGRNGSQLIRA
jgi:hypothetical protein